MSVTGQRGVDKDRTDGHLGDDLGPIGQALTPKRLPGVRCLARTTSRRLGTMISEVDSALDALVRRDALNGSRVDLEFEAPTKDWVARRNAPTISLYLYDIREDLPRRQIVAEPQRNASSGHVTEHRMPSRRFRLSYLVTAWTQRPEDEHRLLSALLSVFVRNEIIPRDLTSGSLAASPYPVILSVCLPPPQDRSLADVWSALGGELKPSLDLVATAPLDAAWAFPAAAAVLSEPTIGVGGPGIAAEGGPGGRRRGRGPDGGMPLGPGLMADQDEIIRGGLVGVPRPAAEDAPAEEGSAGRARKRKRMDEAAAGTEETAAGVDADLDRILERAGGGRIMRVRGIPRP